MTRDRREPCKRTMFRNLCDVRQTPLYIGCIQVILGLIPAFDIPGSLFALFIEYNGLGREFGWLLVCSGVYMMGGALFARRETLHIGLLLSAVIWTSMSVLVANVWHEDFYYLGRAQQWLSPIMMMSPVTAVVLWFSLFRDMLFLPVQILERRRRRYAADNPGFAAQ